MPASEEKQTKSTTYGLYPLKFGGLARSSPRQNPHSQAGHNARVTDRKDQAGLTTILKDEQMNYCNFYRSNTQTFESKEINSSHQQHSSPSGVIVWCTHKHSPAPEDLSRSVVGGGRALLLCSGDFDRCTISSEKF